MKNCIIEVVNYRYWPKVHSPKEVMFLNELEELVGAVVGAAYCACSVPEPGVVRLVDVHVVRVTESSSRRLSTRGAVVDVDFLTRAMACAFA